MAQPKHSNRSGDTLMDLIRRLAVSENIIEPSPHVLKKVMRILGSSIASDSRDDDKNITRIKSRLLKRSDTASALRFQELHHLLNALNTTKQTSGIIYLLSELSETNQRDPVAVTKAFKAPSMSSAHGSASIYSSAPVHTNAPFSSSSQAPSEVRSSRALSHISEPSSAFTSSSIIRTEAHEESLLRDLLFVFQGIDGVHIKFCSEVDSFVLDPSLRLPASTAQPILQMCELGWLFKKVEGYIKSRGGLTGGCMAQALCASLQEDLLEYFRLIAVLEAQLNQNRSSLTLRRLAVWSQDPLERLRLMAVLVDSAGDVRGGALASCLESHLRHGDPMVQALMSRTLRRVCVPLVDMLHRWVYEGELDDPHGEFFVADVQRGRKKNSKNYSLVEEGAWHGRHELVEDLIPRFLPHDLAHQLLVLGKALHFMRRACGDAQWVTAAANKRSSAYSSSSSSTVGGIGSRSVAEAWVGELRLLANEGSTTHARLVELMMKKFQLRAHLSALKKFLLLGQGDFVVVLMDALRDELNKPAELMYRHSLTGIVDGALRASNAQYEPPEVLERLGVKLLPASHGDKGWEVFSLDYKVEAPLTAVITPTSMGVYRQVFHLLWRLKRSDMVLGNAWRLHMMSAKMRMTKRLPELSNILHEANLARNNMWNLLQNLSNYMMFEVLEESWLKLDKALHNASDLDALIKAHEKYLATVRARALLSEEFDVVVEQLYSLMDIIIDFGASSDTLFQDALAEIERLDAREMENKRLEEAGEWGNEYEDDEDSDPSRVAGVALKTIDLLRKHSSDFNNTIRNLLAEAPTGPDVIKFLLFHLDFNGFITLNQ